MAICGARGEPAVTITASAADLFMRASDDRSQAQGGAAAD